MPQISHKIPQIYIIAHRRVYGHSVIFPSGNCHQWNYELYSAANRQLQFWPLKCFILQDGFRSLWFHYCSEKCKWSVWHVVLSFLLSWKSSLEWSKQLETLDIWLWFSCGKVVWPLRWQDHWPAQISLMFSKPTTSSMFVNIFTARYCFVARHFAWKSKSAFVETVFLSPASSFNIFSRCVCLVLLSLWQPTSNSLSVKVVPLTEDELIHLDFLVNSQKF